MRLETTTEGPSPSDIQPAPQKKHTGLIIFVGILMLLALGFVWRTVFFYIKISKGEVIPQTTFASSLTVDKSLSKVIEQSDLGKDELATDDDPNLGATADTALLTIVEFADFGCPFSRDASYIAHQIANNSSTIRYVYRDFPIVELHPNAQWAAEAGECAQDQGRFFDYHDKIYQNQLDLSPVKLKQYARELGLNSSIFNECLDSRKHRDEVEADKLAGIAAGVQGTPTFFFNGIKVEGAVPKDIFNTLTQQFTALSELQK